MATMNDDYFAGFLDGEGCFFIGKHHRRGDGRANQLPYYRAVIHIGSTDRAILEEIKRYLDGGFVSAMRPPINSNHKQAYQFTITGKKKIGPILKRIIPKLRVKRPIAELMLEFLSGVQTHGGQVRIAEKEIARRELLISKARELNRRGISWQ
jgi:hypothetical protein